MPSQSILSADDKAKVKSVIPVSPATNKIYSATFARIYYAYPDPNKWAYAGLQGGCYTESQLTNDLTIFHRRCIDSNQVKSYIGFFLQPR